MFDHILIATDGSPHAERAAEHALALGRALGSRMTAVSVIAPWAKVAGYDAIWYSDTLYKERATAAANAQLAKVRTAAHENGVEVETLVVEHEHPHLGILETAEKLGCSLVVMGSHGRRGLQALLLGSVTSKALTHGTVPILVCR